LTVSKYDLRVFVRVGLKTIDSCRCVDIVESSLSTAGIISRDDNVRGMIDSVSSFSNFFVNINPF